MLKHSLFAEPWSTITHKIWDQEFIKYDKQINYEQKKVCQEKYGQGHPTPLTKKKFKSIGPMQKNQLVR